MKLYTRTGDKGTTGLFGGARVLKDAARVEAYGAVDELNATLGVAVAALGGGAPGGSGQAERGRSRAAELTQIQGDLFRLGAELAAPSSELSAVPGRPLDDADVARLERWIDACIAETEPLRRFVLPGGAPSAAALHHARAVARRAERRIVRLSHAEPVREEIIRYVNRLSDLLFAMARSENARLAAPETEWVP